MQHNKQTAKLPFMTQKAAIAYIGGVCLLPLFVALVAATWLIYSSFAQELYVLKNG